MEHDLLKPASPDRVHRICECRSAVQCRVANSTTISTWSLVEMASGAGGVSACTTNSSTPTSTTGSCKQLFPRVRETPWQTGVAGIPADGKRDLPDISLFGSYGWGHGDNTGFPEALC